MYIVHFLVGTVENGWERNRMYHVEELQRKEVTVRIVEVKRESSVMYAFSNSAMQIFWFGWNVSSPDSEIL